jgi:hypothetical protein
MLIGINGSAGSGKSTAARLIRVNNNFGSIAFADPFKRMLMEVMGWGEYELWGDSENRSRADAAGRMRTAGFHKLTHYDDGVRTCSVCLGEWKGDDVTSEPCSVPVTPRHALQCIGQAGREAFARMWADHAVKTAKAMLAPRDESGRVWFYDRTRGLAKRWVASNYRCLEGVLFEDLRHDDEAIAIREAGGHIIRLRRDGAGLKGEAGRHVSEGGLSACYVDVEIDNNGPIDVLERTLLETVAHIKSLKGAA